MSSKNIKPLEIKDWSFLSEVSEVAMLQVAMERGLMGDIKSMKTMLEWFDLGGIPSMANRNQKYETHVWALMDDPRHRLEVQKSIIQQVKIRGDEFYSTIYKSSFQAAIGASLIREPDQRMEPIKQSEINMLMAHFNPIINRVTPLEKEELSLLDKAIEIFRRPVKDLDFNLRKPVENTTAEGYAGLHALFQTLGSMSVDDQSFRAFDRAGFNDGQMLTLFMRDAFPAELDPKGLPRSLAEDLLGAGNLSGANWCAQAMLAVDDVPHYKVKQTIQAFKDCFLLKSPVDAPHVDVVMKDVLKQEKEQTLTDAMTKKERLWTSFGR